MRTFWVLGSPFQPVECFVGKAGERPPVLTHSLAQHRQIPVVPMSTDQDQGHLLGQGAGMGDPL